MRTVFLLVLCTVSKFSIAQIEESNFASIDEQSGSVRAKSATELAKKLTNPYTNEAEKVRAIFWWITQNIRYDVKGSRDPMGIYNDLPRLKSSGPGFNTEDDYNDRIVQKVLNEKQAICDGYARLFKSLCDNSNIKAIIINGNIRWYSDPVGKATYNRHAWNAVSIDSNWYLLDATWASGTVEGDEFRKRYDGFYFLTDPVKFFNDHFPDDSTWTLLKDPPGFQQFYNSAFICWDFYRSGIISYQPMNGLIELSTANDKVKFEIESDDPGKRLYIIEYPQDTLKYDPRNESSFYRELRKPHISRTETAGKKIFLYHHNSSCKARQVFVYYNDRLVLCYGINRANEDKK